METLLTSRCSYYMFFLQWFQTNIVVAVSNKMCVHVLYTSRNCCLADCACFPANIQWPKPVALITAIWYCSRGTINRTVKFLHDDSHSSLLLYRTLQPEYQYAHYLSEVKCFSNRRLLSRFRSGCHGLRVDTGRWENNVHLDRKDRLCLVCSSAQDVEDEHHFLFDCPAYSSIRASHANLFQCACSVSGFFDNCEANACGGFIRNCFSLRSSILTDFT